MWKLGIWMIIVAPGLALAQSAERGKELYLDHCATCHGIEMDGQGPMAGVLVIEPSDLTGLAANSDGEFPLFRVIKRIDGRDPLVSHGSPMPVYGPFFEGQGYAIKTQSGQPILTSRPIAELVAYLRENQQ